MIRWLRHEVMQAMNDGGIGGDRRAVLRLRENEDALENRLRVKRQTFRAPVRPDAMSLHGFSDIFLDLRGMEADATVASIRAL